MLPPPLTSYPPFDPYGLLSPANPMMVYQTNNFYGSTFGHQLCVPEVTPADLLIEKTQHRSSSQTRPSLA